MRLCFAKLLALFVGGPDDATACAPYGARPVASGNLTTSSQVHLALTQPDACGAGESRGDSETRSLGEDSEKSPNLLISKTPSNESNKTSLRSSASLRLCVKNTPTSLCVKNITQTAQSILDARALYPDSSLADLYDPLTMPPELRKAHAANDAAVMKAYGYAPTMTEPEIVAHLFKLYAAKVACR